MAYRITYQCNVMWVGPGTGPMAGGASDPAGMAPAGGAQTLALFNSNQGQNTLTFLAGDITTLTNGMAADIAAQMTAAIARIQAFSTGTD